MLMMGMVINNYSLMMRDVGVKVWFHDQQVGKLGSLGVYIIDKAKISK